MLRPCDKNIQRTIDLTHEMITLADQGDADREDTGCGILYGMLRDAGYKLLGLAEEEGRRHLFTNSPRTLYNKKEEPIDDVERNPNRKKSSEIFCR